MKTLIVVITLFLFLPPAMAETLRFKNGDTLTGTIVAETDQSLAVSHEYLGLMELKKESLELPESREPSMDTATEQPVYREAEITTTPFEEKGKAYAWQKKISGGYSQSGGNTRVSRGVLGVAMTGKSDSDEWSGKIHSEYATSQEKMNAKKFYGLLRYAHSLEEKRKWYFFKKLEGEHDRFANIDYRLIPSTGFGYWFARTDSWTLMSEASVGYEHTAFMDDTRDSRETKLIPRFFWERNIRENLSFNQEFIFYPSLTRAGEYRFRSQTGLVNKINEHCDVSVRFLDDYNSRPSDLALKNDYRLVSSIDYSF